VANDLSIFRLLQHGQVEESVRHRKQPHVDVKVISGFKHFSDGIILLSHRLRRIERRFVGEGDEVFVQVVPEPSPHVGQNAGWKLSSQIDDILKILKRILSRSNMLTGVGQLYKS